MFMVGAFKVDQAVPLLARYVGSLPSTGTKKSQLQGPRHPLPDVDPERRRGKRAGAAEPDGDQLLRRSAVRPGRSRSGSSRPTRCSTPYCATSLREDLGQTYTVSVGLDQSLPQRGDGYIAVNFGAAPGKHRGDDDRVLDAVKQLQADGPSADLVAQRAKRRASRLRERLRQNSYWMRPSADDSHARRQPGEIVTRTAADRRRHAGRPCRRRSRSISRWTATRS